MLLHNRSRRTSRTNSLRPSAFFFETSVAIRSNWILCLAVALAAPHCGCNSQRASNERSANQTANSATNESKNHSPPTSSQTGYPSSASSAILARATYVDDRQCAECHQEIFDTYQHVGMAKSFYKFAPQDTIENFEDAHYYHEASDNHYDIALVDGHLQQTRYKLRPDHTRVHEHTVIAQYVIGSGNHVRTYLSRNDIGELFQLPIVWYSQDKKWGMAPGYDEATHPDFSRQITRHCMFCHNAYPQLPDRADAFGMAHRFPAQLPQGIGCQRCHGPGSEHVRISNNADMDDQSDVQQVLDSIVNSAKLDVALQDDVCNQCHLQPMSRRTSIVRKFGKGDFEFRAGQRLSDFMAHFEPDHDKLATDEFEINHHPYRLHQSKCFAETTGGIRCTHCHDPHKKVSPRDRTQFYRGKCLACHDVRDCLDTEQGHSPDANCIACHMAERRTEDVIHVTMTDHKIARRSGLADPTAAITERTIPADDPIRSFQWHQPIAGESAEYLIQLFSQILDDDENSIVAFAKEIKNQKPTESAPYTLLLQRQLQYKQYEDAKRTYAALPSGLSKLPINLNYAGTAALGRDEFQVARDLLHAAQSAAPENPEAWYNLGIAESRLGNRDAALACWREAIRLRPSYVKPRIKLGSQLAINDQLTEAAKQFEQALKYDTRNIESHRKLSSVYRLQKHWQQTISVLTDGLQIAPDNPELLKALTLALLEPENQTARNAALALQSAKRFNLLNEEAVESLLVLALANLESANPTPALEAIKSVLKTQSRKAEVGLLLSIAQHMLDSQDTARANFDGASRSLATNQNEDRTCRLIREYAEAYFSAATK